MIGKSEMEKIRDLINTLNLYTEAYDKGEPIISDKEWDDLYFQLVKMENRTGLYYEDSPTQKIHFQEVSKLNKVEHNHPMLSLDKTKSIDDVESFLGSKSFIMMGKMDGLTCSLTYRGGALVKAETRGNGIIGEDILHNAVVVKNIPNKINYLDELTVDGEIICTTYDFQPFAEEYKNPRNFASGSIRLLDSRECAQRNLSFIAWDVFGPEFIDDNLSGKLYELEDFGFTIVPYRTGNLKYNDRGFVMETAIEEMKNICKEKGYPIDGLVFKFDDCTDYELAGKTDHHFKGAIAYKFYDEEYETVLTDIEWTMGRTGQLTPVALFLPIDADGSEISRASLHNISVMEELGIYFKGQKIFVFKANQIIPQISRMKDMYMDKSGVEYEYLHIPEVCPICGGPTEIIQEVDSKVLMCGNPNCEGKLINQLDHWFGKKGLDAKGVSKATIEKLIEYGWVKRARDMFNLAQYKDIWKNISGFGEKSVSNILGAIEACKNCSLEQAIAAAGIPLIGRTVSKDLAKRFTSYGAFKEAVLGSFDFSSLDGYGYEMNKSLKTFNYDELDYIVENYLTLEAKLEETKEQKLEGLTFVVTGKVKIWKNRDELSAEISALGGKVTGSVTKNTNYLINNDVNSTSAKNKKAKELGIEIITEEQFLEMTGIK